MIWIRTGLRSLTAGDRIAFIALIVALPAAVDLLIRQFSAPVLEIVPPNYVEFRANIPVQAKLDDGVSLLVHSNNERVIDADASASRHLHAVIPITFRNDGHEGSVLSVRQERLVIYSSSDPKERFLFDAEFDTEIVPADSTHWWWGNIRPWLPAVLDGGESRSSEVILQARQCASGCGWISFLKFLESNQSIYRVVLEIEVLNGDVFRSSACKIDLGSVFKSNHAAKSDRKRFYRRSAECVNGYR